MCLDSLAVLFADDRRRNTAFPVFSSCGGGFIVVDGVGLKLPVSLLSYWPGNVR